MAKVKNQILALLICLSVVIGGSPASADFVILDDLIVDGSACIGFDCVNGESFSFDTIRLKEHNLRIKFDDTSTASSFPRNDWQLTANSSANGGASKFSIDDITNSRTPFTVEAGARSHSLYVDDGGRIGIRTSTPSTEIHVIDGDTPTLRLQQDGSSGFEPQTWDVAGNETNFFIRDVTNGSQLPFRIRPDAPTSSIFIDVSGDVGFGTSSPDAELHVRTAESTANLRLESTNGGGSNWRFRANAVQNQLVVQDGASTDSSFKIAAGAGDNKIVIATTGVGINTASPNAAAALDVNGPIHNGATVHHPDYVFEPDYELESIEEHAEYMWENKHLPAVGAGTYDEEGKPYIVLSDRSQGVLEELEKAHIYIERLHQRLELKKEVISEILARLQALERVE